MATRETEQAREAREAREERVRRVDLARESHRRRVEARGGAWSACSWTENFWRRVGARAV